MAGVISASRERSWSVGSDQTDKSEQEHLTEERKKELLQNFPTIPSFADDDEDLFRQDDDDHDISLHRIQKRTHDDSLNDLNVKKLKTDNLKLKDDEKIKGQISDELIEHAKSKLSKWAARLFDQNRIRGLIEAPQIIPLNDEFLEAFGKREKEFDRKLGRSIQIDRDEILLGNSEDDKDSDEEDQGLGLKTTMNGDLSDRKIKFTNLSFQTTVESLTARCHVYGPTTKMHLVMDKGNRSHLNVGVAYVTFEDPADAQACMDNMNSCDGRTVRLAWAQPNPSTSNSKMSRKSLGSNRYWERDISTKCHRCGKVGHMVSNCPNPAKISPCPICGNQTEFHDIRSCPWSRVCFTCGVPGHVNRDCIETRVVPRRSFCSTCFASGHHRSICRNNPLYSKDFNTSKCMVCGERGHIMCNPMRWFFGLDGVTCFNCGRNHSGLDCDRPRLETCARDGNLARQELERATYFELQDSLSEQQRRAQQVRGRQFHKRQNDQSARPKSQPPLQRRYGDANRVEARGRSYQEDVGNDSPQFRSNAYGKGQSSTYKNDRGYSSSRR